MSHVPQTESRCRVSGIWLSDEPSEEELARHWTLSEADRREVSQCRGEQVMSVAAKKGTILAVKWSPARGAVRSQPFPLLRGVSQNGPEPSRARCC